MLLVLVLHYNQTLILIAIHIPLLVTTSWIIKPLMSPMSMIPTPLEISPLNTKLSPEPQM